MGVPVSQMWSVVRYVLGQKLRGARRYPMVLMLEPLFRCNLACAGCGKIQYPVDILRKQLTVEQCLQAVDECNTPVVAIPGGEPLLHPQIGEIVSGIVARKKYIYLCTNALLLEKHLDKFTPSKYLSFSVHMDGPREEHDHAVCRDGTYDIAIRAIKKALQKGFRVTTNTTLFDNARADRMKLFFDEMMSLGVEGLMVSPGYSYEKAPDQEHFLARERTETLFRQLFSGSGKRWRLNLSPLFLQFLQGKWDLECTPWGMPTYNLFGWQKPCYLLQEGYTQSFKELLETTAWENYGRKSGNPKCGDCMVHCGYEPTAVQAGFGSFRGFIAMAWLSIFGDRGRPEPTLESQTTAAFGRESAAPLVSIDISQIKPVAVREPEADLETSAR